MSTESDLVDAAKAGDQSAFGQLVALHQDRLFAAMMQITGSPEESEDVVQDAFVRAFLKLHTFQQNSQFFTWLYRIAFNSALSRRRRRKKEYSVEQVREEAGVEPIDENAAPDEQMLRGERVSLIQNALAQLTDDHKSILVLREMNDHAYEEIADILDISIGTVRSRLSRARTQLRIVIEQMQAEENA